MARLPEFEPRFFEQILLDMVNLVRTLNPELTDFNIGSRIRTILEACALEDDEQYHQMAELLRFWNLSNLRGRDLEERLKEWNIYRRGSTNASGEVIFGNGSLTTSFAAGSLSATGTSVQLLSSRGFPPTADAPYIIRIGEGTSNVEDVTVSANNSTSQVLTLSTPLTKDHVKGERVSLVSGSVIILPLGSQVRARATSEFPERTVSTLELARIEAGNYESASVNAEAQTPGTAGNLAAGQIIEFVSGPPFNGAFVRNESPFSGGLNTESDRQFLARGNRKQQSLAKSVPLALEQLVISEEHTTVTGRTFRVISAKLREFYQPVSANDFLFLYIWPGNFDFIETLSVANEVLTSSAEDGQIFFKVANIAIVPQSFILQRKLAGTASFVNMTQGVDYFLNEGTSWVQIASPGLNAGDELKVGVYRYYTGLIQEVQKIVNGAASDPVQYPGIAAAGVKALVTFPRPRTLDTVRLSIQVLEGYSEGQVASLVIDELTNYFQELAIGADIILAEMIERAMSVDGMFNVQFRSPTQDIVLLEDEVLDLENLNILVG